MKNLNAIVWLYRGETEKYRALLREYRTALDTQIDFAEFEAALMERVETVKAEGKAAVEAAPRKEKKATQVKLDAEIAEILSKAAIAREAQWLISKFGDGVYADVPGLCRIAARAEIEGKNWSLTPGAYVGVEAAEVDDTDFAERMTEIHAELVKLQGEANILMETISKNFKEMGL